MITKIDRILYGAPVFFTTAGTIASGCIGILMSTTKVKVYGVTLLPSTIQVKDLFYVGLAGTVAATVIHLLLFQFSVKQNIRVVAAGLASLGVVYAFSATTGMLPGGVIITALGMALNILIL
jgi:hypothetical protein